jgi:hypothetical protein
MLQGRPRIINPLHFETHSPLLPLTHAAFFLFFTTRAMAPPGVSFLAVMDPTAMARPSALSGRLQNRHVPDIMVVIEAC